MTARLALAPSKTYMSNGNSGNAEMRAQQAQRRGNMRSNAANKAQPVINPPPSVAHRLQHEPDFVASQAVFARFLVQTLAYPLIQGALKELFEEAPGNCNVSIVPSTLYFPSGLPVKYGVIRAAVTQATGERSYLIGYYPCATGDLNLLPFHSRDVTLMEGDRLVLLRRPLLPQEEDENSDESQKNEVEVGEIGTEIEGSE